ncbi:tRNA pseudouridine(13) synthase TruD [Thermoflexus sp.]|uniref:tRNA pseudouridine(13) synthase TruD n=1 Tax=Thermoflexus sp. TaxID=1969742 RepID=UPI0035E46188
MRWKVRPEDFQVEEMIELPLQPGGPYTLYQVRKRGRTTLEVQAELAARLGVPQRAVIFPALKDRDALAVQMAAVRGPGPARVQGEGFEAVRVGYADRPLRPQDLRGNRFIVRLRDLADREIERLPEASALLAAQGFPNYFDDQRFGSWSPEAGFIGRPLLLGQAEETLRIYLTIPLIGDPPAVRAFKAEAQAWWGNWAALLERAPRPSNYRSVLVFLRDHPTDWRGAVRRIPGRLRALWVDAYRAWIWNRMLAWVWARIPHYEIEIRGERFPVPLEPPPEAAALVALPHRRARSEPPWLEALAAVLEEEGLQPSHFRRGALLEDAPPPTRRPVWCRPFALEIKSLLLEKREAILVFELPPGSYGTMLLKVLQTWIEGSSAR